MTGPQILQFSDTHIVAPGERVCGAVDTAEALTRAVETANRMLPQLGPVACAVVTGDLTDHGTLAEVAHFRAIMDELAVPYYAVPGNHDRRAPIRETYGDVAWMTAQGPITWTVDLGDMAVIGLDTLIEGAPQGGLSSDALDHLRKALATLAPKPVILALHHHPMPTGIALMDRQNLRDTGPLRALIASYPGPLRLICGHVHRSFTGHFAGRTALICPGTSHAVTLDLRDAPQNTLHIEPGAIMLHGFGIGDSADFYSHTLPTGAFAGPVAFD